MKTTLLKEIVSFLFGRKYYANIINTKGTNMTELCCFIFSDLEEVERHKMEILSTSSYQFVETVSFRSRNMHYNSKNLNG